MENKLMGNKLFLYITEFFAGVSVMAVELGASRLMAPYFSSSQIVWTVIIGVIMIAMAIMCNPRLIIADEPTTALDVTIQAQILDLLQSLQKKLGTAVIMITHDLGVIAGMCSRVLVMYGGVVVEEGTVREIFYEPKHPYTWGLLRSIPQKSGEKRKLIPIPGSPPDLIAPPPGCPFVARCPYAMNICNSALPEMTRLSQTHCARCRLLDEGAPRIVWEGNRE